MSFETLKKTAWTLVRRYGYVSQNIVQFNFPVLVEQLLNGPSEETKKNKKRGSQCWNVFTALGGRFTPRAFTLQEDVALKQLWLTQVYYALINTEHRFTESGPALIVSIYFSVALQRCWLTEFIKAISSGLIQIYLEPRSMCDITRLVKQTEWTFWMNYCCSG